MKKLQHRSCVTMETYNGRIWPGYLVYNRREKIASDNLSGLPNKVNQETTH